MDHFCYLCFVFVLFSCLFIALWERAGLLALLFALFYCVFVTFPCGVLGQVWCLIVSITDLCLLSYFSNTVLPVACIVVVTYLERAELLALLSEIFSCVFVTFPYGVSGQVWYLIVSIPDLCLLFTLTIWQIKYIQSSQCTIKNKDKYAQKKIFRSHIL